MQRYFLFILTTLASFQMVETSGKIALSLEAYNNPGEKEANGDCCDDPFIWRCVGTCDHSFVVCLDELSGSATDMGQCSIGKYTTGIFWNKNPNTFHGDKEGRHDFKFNTWLGGILVKVEVWDNDQFSPAGLVEFLSTEVQMSKEGGKWRAFQVKKRTQLDFRIRVQCDENWYGAKCDVYCNPPEMPVVPYRCSSDGQKQCVYRSFIQMISKGYPSCEVTSANPFLSVTLGKMECIAECHRTCGCTCVSVSSDNECKLFDVQPSNISMRPRTGSMVFVMFAIENAE